MEEFMGTNKSNNFKCMKQNFCKSLFDINSFLNYACKCKKGIKLFHLLKK